MMYLDVFQAELDYAAYKCELDEYAAQLKFDHMKLSPGTLSHWLLGRGTDDLPEAEALISLMANATYRIFFEYGGRYEEREDRLLELLSQTQPRLWAEKHDRITRTGADLLEFTLCNYEDMSFRNGVEAEQLELFEVCAALEERIVGILIAEEYEQ
jgi:hypothetical protein